MRTRSRLSRRSEQSTKQNIIFKIAACIVIIFLVIKYGLPFLAQISLFVSGIKSRPEPVSNNSSINFVSPPVLDPLPQATNSASIIVSGIATTADSISISVNGDLVDTQKINSDGTFKFENIQIKKGENTVSVKSKTKEKKESEPANLTISLKDIAPTLSIDTPSDNQTFSKDQNTTQVAGKTDPGVKVTVNGFWAIVEENGKFSYTLSLKSGDNKITVSAVDDAGNKTQLQRTVKFNP